MPDLQFAPPSLAAAYPGNRLLNSFPDELREMVGNRIDMVELALGNTVLRRGTDVAHSLFPFGTTMISLVVDLDDGRSVEGASIRRAVAGIISCADVRPCTRAEVMVAGPVPRLPMIAIEEAKGRSAHLRNLFCRY